MGHAAPAVGAHHHQVAATLAHLFDVDRDSWLAECDLTEEYFAQFGDRVPAALKAELASLRYHLQHS